MKKYHVAEIPTYCQHRESTDIKDVDRETEESKNVAFEEKIFLWQEEQCKNDGLLWQFAWNSRWTGRDRYHLCVTMGNSKKRDI